MKLTTELLGKHASILFVNPSIEDSRNLAKKLSAGFNPADVFWLTPNPDAKTIQVKETLEFMERTYLSPLGDRKLFIVCDASTMTTSAQNKMLKTIEDAPAQTTFLLLATNIEQILSTIRSRCVTIYDTPQNKTVPLVPQEVIETMRKLFNIEVNEATLTPEQRFEILTTLSTINRRTTANCNIQSQNDLLLMKLLEIYKK